MKGGGAVAWSGRNEISGDLEAFVHLYTPFCIVFTFFSSSFFFLFSSLFFSGIACLILQLCMMELDLLQICISSP